MGRLFLSEENPVWCFKISSYWKKFVPSKPRSKFSSSIVVLPLEIIC